MRKLWKIFLLAGVLCAILCVGTLAAESTSGIYDAAPTAKFASTVTLTPEGGTATQVQVNDITTKTVYVGAEKLSLKYTGAVADNQYLVLALNNDSPTPTADNIVYIDQNGTAEFTIYPSKLQNGTYHIYMSGTDMAYEEVASFSYYSAYVLGDVDADGYWTANDALYTLQIAVNKTTLKMDGSDKEVTETMRMAADTDLDTYVTANDALLILQKAVGKNVF